MYNNSPKEVNKSTNAAPHFPKDRLKIQSEMTKNNVKSRMNGNAFYSNPRHTESRMNASHQQAYSNPSVAINDSTSADSWKLLDHIRFPRNIPTRYNARVYSSSSSNYSPLSSYTSQETAATQPALGRSFLPRLHKTDSHTTRSVYAARGPGKGPGFYYQNQYYGATKDARGCGVNKLRCNWVH